MMFLSLKTINKANLILPSRKVLTGPYLTSKHQGVNKGVSYQVLIEKLII